MLKHMLVAVVQNRMKALHTGAAGGPERGVHLAEGETQQGNIGGRGVGRKGPIKWEG